MNNEINVGEEIATAALGRFHFRLGALVAAILFFDGYDLFNAAYVAPYVRSEWHLGPIQLGILLSAGIAGLSIGSLSVGILADRVGRRKMLLVSLWLISAASALLGAVVSNFYQFIGARLLLGFGVGMLTPLALTLLNEWAPHRVANRFTTSVFIIGFAGGGIGAGVIGITLAPTYGWRALYLVGALSLLVTAIAHYALPESIRFLIVKERWQSVRVLLVQLNGHRAALYAEAVAFVAPEQTLDSRKVTEGWLRKNVWNTLNLWFVSALSLFCIHGLTNWLPTVMIGKGLSVTAAFSLGILVMVMQILGGLATGQLSDRWRNRRRVMSIMFFGGAVTMFAFAMVTSILAMIVLLALAAFFIFGAQAVLNNFTALSYETRVRATGTGFAVGIARVGGVLGPFIIGLLQGLGGSLFIVFAVIATTLLAAALLIQFCAPELEGTLVRAPGH